MCKVLILTNVSKIKLFNKTVFTIAKEITETEEDGFGYTLQGEQGLFGERSTKPEIFRPSWSRDNPETPFTIKSYERFGTKSKLVGAGLFHGRTSTNDVNLINTHPINKDGWSLIHNGVVTNNGPQYKMLTTNDTEHCLHYLSTEGIKGLETHLTGYYALGAIDPMGRLHVIKDNTANLFYAYSETIESGIFGTTSDLIETVAKELEWKISVVSEVKNNQYMIYKDNKVESHSEFTPRGRTSYESQWASKSLGRELESVGTFGRGHYLDNSAPISIDPRQEYLGAEPSLNSEFSEDEMYFLNECYEADASYTFLDYKKNSLDLETFQALEDNEKLYCTVIRADGTIVDPDDYSNEQLYSGAI